MADSGVGILPMGKPRYSFSRMLQTIRNIVRQVRDLGGDIYHVRKPELIPVVLALAARKWFLMRLNICLYH